MNGPVRFVDDVMPLVNKLGCNLAACHGSAQGKAGFKLSMFGADPEFDYAALTKAADFGQAYVVASYMRQFANARIVVPQTLSAMPILVNGQYNQQDHDIFRFHPDPLLIYHVEKDGEYLIDVRDALFRGREDLVYRLSIGVLPYLTHIYPLGGQRPRPPTSRRTRTKRPSP